MPSNAHKKTVAESNRRILPPWLAWSYAALLVITLLFWGVNLRRESSVASHAYSRDFLGVYIGARMVAEGHGAQIYDFEVQRKVMDAATAPYARFSLMPFVYPAFVAMLLSPLGKLSLGAALLVWTTVNLAAAFWTARLLIEYLPNSTFERLAWAVAFLAWIPLQLTLIQGQLGLICTLAITGTCVALRKGSQVHAGCWLALGLLKPQLIVFPLLALVIWRYWRAVFVFAIALVAILGTSFARLGFWIPGYMKFVWDYNRLGSKVALYPVAMQNWRGLVFAVFKSDASLASHLVLAALTLASLIVAIIMYSAARPPELRLQNSNFFEWEPAFAIGIVLGTLSSPHLYLHDWVVALPAMTILLCVAKEFVSSENIRRRKIAILVVWLIGLAPFLAFAVQFGLWPTQSYIQLLPWYMAGLGAMATAMTIRLLRVSNELAIRYATLLKSPP
jgi:hypothetical protein